MREIGPAGADVGAEHVGAVALVVHAAGERRVAVAELGRIAEAVDGGAADRRQEDLEVGARDQLRIHAAGLLVQSAPQIASSSMPKRSAMPGRYQTGSIAAFITRTLPCARHDVAVGADAAGRDGVADFRHVDMGAGDRDGRPHVVAAHEVIAEGLADQVAPGIERHDLLRHRSIAGAGRSARPARCRSGRRGGRARAFSPRSRARDRPNSRRRGVPTALRWRGIAQGRDHRPALGGGGRAPVQLRRR